MMKNELRPYDEYRKIDLPWLSEIPQHWGLTRNKNVLKTRKSLVGSDHGDYKLLSLTLNGIIERDMLNPKGKFPKEFDNYQVVKEEDIVFCLFDVDETPRTVGLSKHEGMITGAYNVYEIDDVNSKFIYYYYLALDNGKLMKPLYTGLRKVISSDTFLRTKCPLPPREEQDQIVKYLDYKLAKINKFIKAKKKLIVSLKEQKQAIINRVVTKGLNHDVEMKPSGIEWLGHVPKHWNVVMNKRIFKENCRSFSENNETILSLSQKDGVIPYSKMKERSLHTSSYENWKLVLPNDLVLNRFKAHLGVFFSSDLRGIVTFHYGVYEPIRSINSKYYEFLYHTSGFKTIFAGRSNGMTVGLQNLSNRNFYNVYTLLPPIEEQNLIVDYINNECALINEAIEKIENEINLISEYKKIIISDVSTGQINVRDIEISDNICDFEEVLDFDNEDDNEEIDELIDEGGDE